MYGNSIKWSRTSCIQFFFYIDVYSSVKKKTNIIIDESLGEKICLIRLRIHMFLLRTHAHRALVYYLIHILCAQTHTHTFYHMFVRSCCRFVSSRGRDRLIDRYIKGTDTAAKVITSSPRPLNQSRWIPWSREPRPSYPEGEIQIKNCLYYQIALVKYSVSW